MNAFPDPRAHGPEAASFYHLGDADTAALGCTGTACLVARRLAPALWDAARRQSPRLACRGQCHAAPADPASDPRPAVHVHAREAVVLGRLAAGGARPLRRFEELGGRDALARGLALSPAAWLDEVARSGLRGRGGAGFPTARKWQAAAARPPGPRHVVANADEGDAGAFVDRFLVEDDPHAVLAGMLLAAHAVGASRGWIYLRAEYAAAGPILAAALAEARAAGMLGPDALGPGRPFDVEVRRGHGSYVCGEETALIRSIEGLRPEVMARPPYATERGLFGQPTVVNNVETLACLPWIARHGGDAHAALGTGRSRGTKVLSLNSLFARPGLHEVELGTPLRRVVEEFGGGLRGGARPAGILLGGPFAAIVPPDRLDVPLGFEELRAIGASLGHGGVVAFDDATPVAVLARHVADLADAESCGKCTPCRLGSRRLARLLAGAPADARLADLPGLADLSSALRLASLCGLGVGLAEFLDSAVRLQDAAHGPHAP